MSAKHILKNNLIDIYNNYHSYDLISLYRNLLKYNNDIKKYMRDYELYDIYITELYNIIDEYAYGNDKNELTKIKTEFIIIIEKVINYL
jgi:hypothetical protein